VFIGGPDLTSLEYKIRRIVSDNWDENRIATDMSSLVKQEISAFMKEFGCYSELPQDVKEAIDIWMKRETLTTNRNKE
jgi:hypothetical protein